MVDVIFAPDGLSLEDAVELCRRLKGSEYGNWLDVLKIHDLYDRHAGAAVEPFAKLGLRVWVDAKLHDTPDTVRLRARAFKDAGASIVTVHASGDTPMMEAAKESELIVYGVTVLTSLDGPAVRDIYNRPPGEEVERLLDLALRAKLDGIVCSAVEANAVRSILSPVQRGLFHIVVPGTRSVGSPLRSQKRSATPGVAVANGATHVVVASEVVGAEDPVEAFGNFVQQVDEAQD